MEGNPRDRWRRKRFKDNLNQLLTERGLTRKAASDAAEVDYDWLRRAVSRGIAWPDKRSMEWLKKLGDTLGLDDVERLWRRHFVVPPEPSSIKDEADKLGEEMRRYVLLVGAEDATLKGIVEQMRRAVRARQIADVKAKPTPSTSPPSPRAPAAVEPPSESVGGPSSSSRSTGGVRPAITPSTPPQTIAEKVEHARRAIAEARAGREAARGEPSSSGLSTSDQVSSLPIQEPTHGVGDLLGGPAQDGAVNEVAQRPARSSIGQSRSTWADGLIAELARRVLVDFDHQYLRGFREMGLPRIEEATLTAAEFLFHAQSGGLDLSGEQSFHLAYLPWLERYGDLLGTTWERADSYVLAWRYFWERRGPSDGDTSPGGQPSDALARLRGLSPDALIARHMRERDEKVVEEFRRTRETARPLVGRVLDSLSPVQHAHFFGAFDSPERGELYLLDELTRRIRDTGIDEGRPFPPDASDEAVRGLVVEIVEDFEKSRHGEGGDDLALLTSDPETVVAPSKSLDFRHGDDPPLDDDNGDRRPVGAALEAESARSIAEDREALERTVNDFWVMLGDTPLPDGSGTYRDRIGHLGDPESVATVALRASEGDILKALERLIGEVDRLIEGERSARLAGRSTGPSPGGAGHSTTSGPHKQRKRRKTGEILRLIVMELRGLGLGVPEIVEKLLDGHEGVPKQVRGMDRTELARRVRGIIARTKSDDGPDLGEFDARGEDDKRAWEMGYEDDPDDRYWRGGRR